jgi:hypothetical protein
LKTLLAMKFWTLLLALMLWPGAALWAQQWPAPIAQSAVQTAPARAPGEQQADTSGEQQSPADDTLLTMFPQHQWNRFWISGQINLIEQGHGDFPALYSGPNSFSNVGEHALSRIFTLYTAARLTKYSDLVFDLEEASGLGLSNSLGLAGYTNIDVVRIPGEGSPLSTAPYMSRLIFRQVIPLGHESEEAEVGPLGVLPRLPTRRLEIRLGNFAMPDFFDVNSVGSDSHLQFMNWTVVNDGAWDYAANTRGYTWGGIVELHGGPGWSLRFAEALMPKIANGYDLAWDLRQAHAHNLEFELRPRLLKDRHTAIRLLGYRNIADMGNYREAINDFLQHLTPTPDVISTRQPGRSKNGVGLNLEQELTPRLRAFLRAGWSDGKNESFAYTEVGRTAVFGGDYLGERWHRKHDKVGAAFVVNGISAAHSQYLALGGLGFLLGDGALRYGHEQIFEGYYTAHLWRGIFGALDMQHLTNPGYNQNRGPVWVETGRLHVDF